MPGPWHKRCGLDSIDLLPRKLQTLLLSGFLNSQLAKCLGISQASVMTSASQLQQTTEPAPSAQDPRGPGRLGGRRLRPAGTLPGSHCPAASSSPLSSGHGRGHVSLPLRSQESLDGPPACALCPGLCVLREGTARARAGARAKLAVARLWCRTAPPLGGLQGLPVTSDGPLSPRHSPTWAVYFVGARESPP